jgi:hypothetical protein
VIITSDPSDSYRTIMRQLFHMVADWPA